MFTLLARRFFIRFNGELYVLLPIDEDRGVQDVPLEGIEEIDGEGPAASCFVPLDINALSCDLDLFIHFKGPASNSRIAFMFG